MSSASELSAKRQDIFSPRPDILMKRHLLGMHSSNSETSDPSESSSSRTEFDRRRSDAELQVYRFGALKPFSNELSDHDSKRNANCVRSEFCGKLALRSTRRPEIRWPRTSDIPPYLNVDPSEVSLQPQAHFQCVRLK